MSKGIALGVFVCIAVFDVMLILGCGKLEQQREKQEQKIVERKRELPEDYRSCDNCYYELWDAECYPCSMCIRGSEREDMWRKGDA